MIVKFLIVAICFTYSAFAADNQLAWLYGRWKIAADITSTPITEMSQSEADALLGSYLYLGPKTFRFGGQTCDSTYQNDSLSRREFQKGYKLEREDMNDLHLPNRVSVVGVGCADVVLTGSPDIILYWKGFFYRAVKVPASKAGNNPNFKDQHAAPQPQHSDH